MCYEGLRDSGVCVPISVNMGRVFDPHSGADMKYLRVTEWSKKLRNLALHNYNTLANNILLIKSRNIAVVEHIRTGKIETLNEILF